MQRVGEAMTMQTRLRCLLLLGASVLGLAGCQTTDPKREIPEHDIDVTDGKPFRPAADKHENFFFNPKSSEIERSLGL
jgi:hypothetical protein